MLKQTNPGPRRISELGFTFVELLVTIAILGLLAGLAVNAYDIYKENAYNAIADGAFAQTRAALEAGKIDSESFPNQVLITTTVGPGAPSGMEGELLLPGLTVPKDVRIYVFHQPGCAARGCVEDVIHVRHCKSTRAISYSSVRDVGQVLNRNALVEIGC